MNDDSRRRRRFVRVDQPRGHAQPPWVAIVVGLGVAAVAGLVTGLFSASSRMMRFGPPGRAEAPEALSASSAALASRLGALMAAVGLGLAALGIYWTIRSAAAARSRAASPSEPWLADYAWDPEAARDESPREGRGALVKGLVMLALLGAFAAVLLADATGSTRKVIVAIAAVLAAGDLAFVGWGLHRLLRCARHGSLRLRFRRFPYLLGEPLELDLIRPASGPALGPIEATLRCIQEVREVERSGGDSGWTIYRSEVWSETKRLEPTAPRALRFPVEFALPPAFNLSTELSTNPPRYWELEVWSRCEGIDLGGTFLVPIYAPVLATTVVDAPP